MSQKIYTHAVKAGGKIIAAGVPVEVGAGSVFTDEYMTEHSAAEAQSAFDSLKAAIDTVNTDDLKKMKKAELEDYAEMYGISLDGCSTKTEYIAAIAASLEVSK